MSNSTARVLKDVSAETSLKARIAELEAQVASGFKPTIVKVGINKYGNSSLEFTGNFVPFSLTIQKAQRFIDHIDAIKTFVETKGKAC